MLYGIQKLQPSPDGQLVAPGEHPNISNFLFFASKQYNLKEASTGVGQAAAGRPVLCTPFSPAIY